MFWDERKVHLAAVIVLTLALLVVLTITTINLNNTTTLLTTAILNNKSDWTAIRTFSFSATDLTSGGKTIDISGGGKFVTMTDIYYNVWLKGNGNLSSVKDGKKVHWKTAKTGLYNQLEGTLEFTANPTGNISWITKPIEVMLTQSSNPEDTTGSIRITIGTEVFEGPAVIVISW